MNWILIIELLYLLVLVIVCIRIIYDTDSTAKTLAYLLLAIFLPLFGIFFYFSFGINYRKRELYSKKIINDDNLWDQIKQNISLYSVQTYYNIAEEDRPNKHLAKYLIVFIDVILNMNMIRGFFQCLYYCRKLFFSIDQ